MVDESPSGTTIDTVSHQAVFATTGKMPVKEIGILCGTFNPIHLGHLIMAECAREQFALEKVFLVTCGEPPHKQDPDLIDKELRHQLVAIAAATNPYFEASRLELDRPGPSYTIDTILNFKAIYPPNSVRLNLIVGEDNLKYITTWHRADELLSNCRLLVGQRHPYSNLSNFQSSPNTVVPEFYPIEFPALNISSSCIRERLKHNQSILYMVLPEINQMLLAQGLYRHT